MKRFRTFLAFGIVLLSACASSVGSSAQKPTLENDSAVQTAEVKAESKNAERQSGGRNCVNGVCEASIPQPTPEVRPGPSGCSFLGSSAVVPVGQEVASADSCGKCVCTVNGVMRCERLKGCVPAPKLTGCAGGDVWVPVGHSLAARDGCNKCSCQKNGRFACTERRCP